MKNTMNIEMQKLQKNHTCEMVDLRKRACKMQGEAGSQRPYIDLWNWLPRDICTSCVFHMSYCPWL